ncbi:MAG: hypothetical protein ACNA8H_01885 [Anaerolineales bacterium]
MDLGETFRVIFVAIPVLLLVSLPIISAFWAMGDAERRGKSGCLVALLVLLLAWPAGLIVWLVFRPPEWRPPDEMG